MGAFWVASCGQGYQAKWARVGALVAQDLLALPPLASGQPQFTHQFEDEVYVPLRNELPDLWSLEFGTRELPTEQRLVLDSLSTSPGRVRHVVVVLGCPRATGLGTVSLNTETSSPSSWPSV